MNYCRAKEAKEKLKIQTEFNTLGNNVKVKPKQAKKNITRIYSKRKTTNLSKTWEDVCSIVNVGRKSKSTPWALKHNDALFFHPVKKAATFNFFFTNIGPNIENRIPTRKKSPMTYLKNKIFMFYYFYSTTPKKCIKMIKCFYNNKLSSPESLLTQLLKNCVDV